MRWGQRLWAEKAQQGRRPPHRPLVRGPGRVAGPAGGVRAAVSFSIIFAVGSGRKEGRQTNTERGNPQFSLCLNFLWARWRGVGCMR